MPARCPRPVATLLIATLIFGVSPALAAEPNEVGTSRIVGKITSGDKKKPVEGAEALAYHLSSAQVYRSASTAADGRFEFTGLLHGYYDLAIQTNIGLWVGTSVINAPPNGKAVANLHLIPSSAVGQSEEARDFPGADQAPIGIAQFVEGGMKPKGIALLTAGGVLGALGIASLLNESDAPPPSATLPGPP